MSVIRDLEPCKDLPFPDLSKWLAIGWLERKQSFQTGEVAESFFEKLCTLLQHPWQPPTLPVTAGVHYCDLCRFTRGNITHYKGLTIPTQGSSQIFVPGKGVIYVAPVVIAHYIDAHNYQPPSSFIDAVMDCPTMRSREYLKMILENGGRVSS